MRPWLLAWLLAVVCGIGASTPALTAAPLQVEPKNWARELEPGWWEWGVYLDGVARELDKVKCVEYTLHPTFPNPVRTVCSRKTRFELNAKGWGTFTIRIKVLLQDGSVYHTEHPLRF